MSFTELREKDQDKLILSKIWEKLPLSDRINFSLALHPPETCSKQCKVHRCSRNPCAKLLRRTTPAQIQPFHCPICQILLLSKEFGGACPNGWNPTTPINFFNRQDKKQPLLFKEDPNTGELR